MSETKRVFFIWAILIILTVVGYIMGERGMSGSLALTILLSAALIKSQLVISYFMEMRYANTRLKWIPTIWLLLVLSAIAIAIAA